jgi:hypothetical protein
LSFNYCTFRNGAPDGTLLVLNNNQDMLIQDAVFPANSTGSAFNVAKTLNQGYVYFDNATGLFSGPLFENDLYNLVDWSGYGEEQDFLIPGGWSGISSYIIPANPDLEVMFDPIIDQLVILFNLDGTYWPAENLNTLGNWSHHTGYVIKVAEDVLFTITGQELTNKTIGIKAGWNLIPVYSTVNASSFLSDLTGFVVAKGVATPEILWPDFNINTLQLLQEGKAYFVYSTQPGFLTYSKAHYDYSPGVLQMQEYHSPWNMPSYTPNSQLVAFTPESLKLFNSGDILAAFNPDGQCAGLTVLNDIEEAVAMAIFGDDLIEETAGGFRAGEPLRFRRYCHVSGEIVDLDVMWDENYDHSGCFESDGLSVVVDLKVVSAENVSAVLIKQPGIYPNPTKDVFTISGLEEHALISIFDVTGKEVFKRNMRLPATIDISNRPEGIYFISVKTNKLMFVEKLIINQ